MPIPSLGIQLIVFGKQASDDLESVMRSVKDAGYDGIEAGNLSLRRSIDDARALFSRTGLKLSGVHSGFGDFEDQDKLAANVEFLNNMGSRYLMCSGVAAGDSLDAYR